MPSLIIDNRPITVDPGVKVIDAAEQLGIVIPRFCYHPALGAVGACRVCAVMFEEGPVRGLKMSCMVDAADDMVVSTEDPQAVAFRCQVIEWLMRNHPHDCPVCDEGGHCLLQDMTIAGGHGLRFSQDPKRTHLDQYLGPLVQHEMNRCIQCYRCVRYYREHSGYRDLGVMGIGDRVYYGRHENGPLDSPFAGNLIDLCPTGVFTDKPARYKGRRWDLERTSSVCVACSLGCGITVSTRYREVVRHEARVHPHVNGHFICDRGRFAHAHANLENRPRQAVQNSAPLEGDPLETSAKALQTVIKSHGSQAVACLGSARSSLETLQALKTICDQGRFWGPVLETDAKQTEKTRQALAGLSPELTIDLADLETADLILAVGVDPLNETPMLAMTLRQAVRKGARLVVLDPRPVRLPCDMDHLPVAPTELESALTRVTTQFVTRRQSQGTPDSIAPPDAFIETKGTKDPLSTVAECLAGSQRPMVICGTRLPTTAVIARCAGLVRILHELEIPTGLLYTLPDANSYASALLSAPEQDIEILLTRIETGQIKALVIVEADPLETYANRARLQQALDRLDDWMVIDHLPTNSMAHAPLALPCANLYESGGLFVNHAGRLQQAQVALAGGTPVRQTGQGDHPPRQFGDSTRGPVLPSPVNLLKQLAHQLELSTVSPDADPQWLRSALAADPHKGLHVELPETGQRLELTEAERPRPHATETTAQPLSDAPAEQRARFITVIWNDSFLGSDPYSGYAPWLQQSDTGPLAYMHSQTAAALDLDHGTRIQIDSTPIGLAVVDNMAPDCIVLPRHRDWPWQTLIIDNGRLERARILTLEFEPRE